MATNDNVRTIKSLVGILFGRYILKPFVDWRAQRAAFDELMSLDDRTLKDIGVARCEIRGLVAHKIAPQDVANDNRPLQSRPATRTRSQSG